MFIPDKFFVVRPQTERELKTESGLFILREGNEFDRISRVGIVEHAQKQSKYNVGDKVIFFHMIANNKTTQFANEHTNTHYLAQDKDIVGYITPKGLVRSKDRLVCEHIEVETTVLAHTKKETLPQSFKVIYSPFKDFKKGDIVTTTLNGGYAIEELKKVFIPLNRVLLKNDEPLEGYNLVKESGQEDTTTQSGIIIKNKDYNKLAGIVEKGDYKGKKVMYIKRRGRVFELNDELVTCVENQDILATHI